jgi:hypothetical protein
MRISSLNRTMTAMPQRAGGKARRYARDQHACGEINECFRVSLEAKGNQYVVAGRDELGFAVNDQRKNRKAHRSQRNGLRNVIARILSMIPMRLDRWMRSLVHCGQFTITMLLTIWATN